MDKFIKELKESKIISKEDIDILKEYISKKYTDKSSHEKSQILSNSIHRILDKNLDGLPDNYKPLIKVNILKNTFIKNKSLVSLYDIFNSCVCEKDFILNFSNSFTKWINLKVTNKTSEKDIKNYTQSINSAFTKKNSKVKADKFSNDSFFVGMRKKRFILCIILILISFYPVTKVLGFNSKNFIYFAQKEGFSIKNLDEFLKFSTDNSCSKYPNSHLPSYMHYTKINDDKLKIFLIKRDSLLSKEPYFSTIIYTAKEFNLNPLVLFAITGQEQSFVPMNNKDSNKIANNPFNVYHSWKEYNTNIDDSSKIAARTIINLSKDIPENANPFLWIGKSYAEDNNWGNGVSEIFKELNEYMKK